MNRFWDALRDYPGPTLFALIIICTTLMIVAGIMTGCFRDEILSKRHPATNSVPRVEDGK